MKVVIVHDYLLQYGGAERVVEALLRVYPEAAIYTSLYAPDALGSRFAAMDVRAALRVRGGGARRLQRYCLPLYPRLFRRLRLPECDVVLTSASAFAKAVAVPAGAAHVCYCYAPTRYLWDFAAYAAGEGLALPARAALRPLIARLRAADRHAARTVDHFVAISHEVAHRIERCYGRFSTVVHPPAAVRAVPAPVERPGGDYFLVVSRLVPYKRIEVAIEACNRLGAPLVVVGDGRLRPRLARLAGPTVQFAGTVSDAALAGYLRGCRALVFPGREDFGLVPIEAMAHGKPVVALAAGGALETVVDGVTGSFFATPDPEVLAERLRSFRPAAYDPRTIRAHAEQFDEGIFRRRLHDLLLGAVQEQHDEREYELAAAAVG